MSLSRLRQVAFFAATFLWLANSAQAGHYDLVDIDQIPAPERERLVGQGVTNTLQLLERGAKRKDRGALARKAQIPRKTLDLWVRFCDLLRVDGVGPKMAALFQACKVFEVKTFRNETPAALLLKMQEANAREQISEILPTEGHLEAWIGQAKRLPIIVE